MSASVLIGELRDAGVSLWEDDGQLRFRAVKGVMTPERVAALREHKDAVLAYLRNPAAAALQPAPGERHEPFPVTDVQSAYLLGRRDVFAYGGVACHGYGELTYPRLDVARLQHAWQALIRRHGMLRAVLTADGSQRVLPTVPDYHIEVTDADDEQGCTEAVEATRRDLGHTVYDPQSWPLFGLRVTRGPSRAVLHFSIDFLIADFVSIEVILDEVHRLYADPDADLPDLELTYRDYRLAERRIRDGEDYERDRAYWTGRIDDLPAAPDLPVLPPVTGGPRPVFRRHEVRLEPAEWAGLRERAARFSVSPSTAVLAAYAETVARWSRSPRFCLDITLLQRLPVHPQVNRLVGDFTSVSLLAVDHDPAATFAGRAAAVQAQLWQDLDHRLFSGIEVMREIGRRRGADAALMPVVFTSAIGLAEENDTTGARGEFTHGISQTPQVWIDCQNIERRGGLASNWDVRAGVLPDHVVEDMFTAYATLLRDLATGDDAWQRSQVIGLPPAQAARRAEVNATTAPLPEGLLQDGFLDRVARAPERVAVIAGDRSLTYGELAARSAAVVLRLRAAEVAPGELVGVVMDKGWEQVAAVLGILRAGAAYLPVDTNQPAPRRDTMLGGAGVRVVLTQSWCAAALDTTPTVVAVDELEPVSTAIEPATTAPDDLAYVVYTSGSTGVPKGVMISHRGARTTVDDINDRFGVGPDDRVLALAGLGFDLSVYDIFGILAAGGALVLPDASRRGDPSHWAALVAGHAVTVWNSVPAQAQMLTDYLSAAQPVALPALRLALLSGDWIPVTLPGLLRARVPGLRVISLGGATEASIWSIYHEIGEVPEDWHSIPYGRPLTNQTFHVLDDALTSCPDTVAGELHIGGAGVALGYLGDPERTAERFVRLPGTGERVYRTGDLGRYLPDGEIEFLGRRDAQVKIRGHRIEPAEIEAVLLAHPGVDAAVCVAGGARLDRHLAAFVEPARQTGADPSGAVEKPLAAARAAGAAVLSGVDRDRYRSYTRGLDDLAVTTMLRLLVDEDVFADGATPTAEEIIADLAAQPRHHRLVRRWLRTLQAEGMLARDDAGRHTLTEAAARRSDADLAAGWQKVADLGSGIDDVRLLDYFRASGARLGELIRGDDDPLALLFPQGRVELSDDLYANALFNRWANAVTATAVARIAETHTGPGPLRVLEVGAGAGGTSSPVLAALAATGTEIDYLYTDLSQFFLNAARERFAAYPWARFAVYDLDADPRAQGLSGNSFDVIIAGDVLHATRDVGATLGRLARLAAPGGRLVVQEMTRDHFQIMTSLELLVRLDEAVGDFTDDRHGRFQTFLSPPQWQRLLTAAGAGEVRSLPDDDDLLDEIGMRVFVALLKSDRVRVTPAELRTFTAERLPDHMVPPVIEVVDALPVTANGKVDRAGLLASLPRRAGETALPDDSDDPGSDLEQRLSALWAQVLKVERVGRHQSFYELGGDSLLAAQLAGRIGEEVPEATLFFDELLRLILERPSVAALAAGLAEFAAAPKADEEALARTDSALLWLRADGAGTVQVVVHDGTGTAATASRLVEDDAPVAVLTGPAGLPVTDLPPDVLLDRLADAYVAALTDAGLNAVRLTGHGVGATLTLEVARRLTELGVDVQQLVLLRPRTLAVPVTDEAMADCLLARVLGVGPAAGLPADEAMAAAVDSQVTDDFARWSAQSPADRLAMIATVTGAGPAAPETWPLARALLLSSASAGGHVYFGDATVRTAADDLSAFFADPAQVWPKRCLGEVVVEPLDMSAATGPTADR